MEIEDRKSLLDARDSYRWLYSISGHVQFLELSEDKNILVPRAYDLFCQRWDRRALVSAITGCREIHDIR